MTATATPSNAHQTALTLGTIAQENLACGRVATTLARNFHLLLLIHPF